MVPPYALDALYCSEEHWEEDDNEERGFDHQPYSTLTTDSTSPILAEQDLFWDDHELISLLSKERPNELFKSIQIDPSLAAARRRAVDWMLKISAHYSFSALTAVLAVDYFDRFLSCFHFQTDKPWMSQLAAVACISLAAKVEETQVPLLLDLQVEDSRYLFETKTIKKMELLVLSTLEWRMNPVTPFSFVDYISRRLGFKDHICREILRQCERTVLSVILDSDFMSFLPSVMATATMLHAFKAMEPHFGVEYDSQLLTILGIEKGNVEECCKLISDASRRNGNQFKKRKFGSIPGSPNGVIDVSFSSDSSNESWSVASSDSSSPEPSTKKNRAMDHLPLEMANHSTATNCLDMSSPEPSLN
ncbi:cyclin-D3-3-like [Cucurbita moschata]|uniref:B-like cyclin n=1 Tax=Cucurbita moschata TaxID=3662 RepID=A0A6J1HCR7_CUCMO|nr:cyclin-D3-3-like [Cucurbita moschata]